MGMLNFARKAFGIVRAQAVPQMSQAIPHAYTYNPDKFKIFTKDPSANK